MHRFSFELIEHALISDRSSPIFIYDRSVPSYIADRFDKLRFHSVVANLLLGNSNNFMANYRNFAAMTS